MLFGDASRESWGSIHGGKTSPFFVCGRNDEEFGLGFEGHHVVSNVVVCSSSFVIVPCQLFSTMSLDVRYHRHSHSYHHHHHHLNIIVALLFVLSPILVVLLLKIVCHCWNWCRLHRVSLWVIACLRRLSSSPHFLSFLSLSLSCSVVVVLSCAAPQVNWSLSPALAFLVGVPRRCPSLVSLVVVPHRHYCHYYHHNIVALSLYPIPMRCCIMYCHCCNLQSI
jgi:hypothetical protein